MLGHLHSEINPAALQRSFQDLDSRAKWKNIDTAAQPQSCPQHHKRFLYAYADSSNQSKRSSIYIYDIYIYKMMYKYIYISYMVYTNIIYSIWYVYMYIWYIWYVWCVSMYICYIYIQYIYIYSVTYIYIYIYYRYIYIYDVYKYIYIYMK